MHEGRLEKSSTRLHVLHRLASFSDSTSDCRFDAALPARSLCRVASHHQLIATHLRSTRPILRDCDKVITAPSTHAR